MLEAAAPRGTFVLQPGDGAVLLISAGVGATPVLAMLHTLAAGASGRDGLLELAEACDVPVRWSCRTGVCHSCETDLLSGTVSYAPDPIDEPAAGSTLICCSQPSGDLVLDL